MHAGLTAFTLILLLLTYNSYPSTSPDRQFVIIRQTEDDGTTSMFNSNNERAVSVYS